MGGGSGNRGNPNRPPNRESTIKNHKSEIYSAPHPEQGDQRTDRGGPSSEHPPEEPTLDAADLPIEVGSEISGLSFEVGPKIRHLSLEFGAKATEFAADGC